MSETIAQVPKSNGFLLNKQLVKKLRSVVTRGKRPIDKVCSDRDLIDHVVAEMYQIWKEHPIYCTTVPEKDATYTWFNASSYEAVRDDESIVDKGRFVDACIIAYIYGTDGVAKWCTSSRVVYPKQLDHQKLLRLQNQAAEMADAKCVDSEFIPCTEPIS